MRYLIMVFALLSFVACAQKGDKGNTGASGAPGAPCQVSQFPTGVSITCGSTYASISNGEDGTDGTDGQDGEDLAPSPYDIVEIIQPCPTSGNREVLIRYRSGQLMAHYSDGTKQFLTLLKPGNYRLTDGSSCLFTVHADMSVTW